MRRIVLACVCCVASAIAQSTPSTAITLEEVVRLTRAGVTEELVVTKVKKSGKAFDLSTDEILELKRSGVSDGVIRILMDPNLPYTPPPPKPAEPSPATAPKPAVPEKPVHPLAAAVPPEPGVYFRLNDADPFRPLEFKPVAAGKSGGKMMGMITAGMKKAGVQGYLVGPQAQTIVKRSAPEFLVRLPEKAAPEDIILIAADAKKDRREVDFGSDATKPTFPPEAVRQYKSSEVVPGLFRFQCSTLEPGEYVFVVLGSGDEKKGVLAKGWEFQIPTRPK